MRNINGQREPAVQHRGLGSALCDDLDGWTGCWVGLGVGREAQKRGDICMWVLSCFSHLWLFATLWTAAHQAPLSMGFSRQEYWSGLPYPPPGDLPDPRIEPTSPVSYIAGGFFTYWATWKVRYTYTNSWCTLLYSRNKHNSVKQLYPDQRGKEKNLRGETHSKESTRKEGNVLSHRKKNPSLTCKRISSLIPSLNYIP